MYIGPCEPCIPTYLDNLAMLQLQFLIVKAIFAKNQQYNALNDLFIEPQVLNPGSS